MGERAVVFLGPSAPPYVAADGRVVVRPAARSGDLRAALDEGYTLIGLVDGDLYDVPAVTPTEVREAVRRAVVYGAASLGALRACECDGVIGVGEVYAMFRDGVLAADDEVVGVYEPVSRRTVAWPLVIVRDALRRLNLPASAAQDAVHRLQRLPFHDRTSDRVLDAICAQSVARPAAVAALCQTPNVKQRDVAALLAQIHQRLG